MVTIQENICFKGNLKELELISYQKGGMDEAWQQSSMYTKGKGITQTVQGITDLIFSKKNVWQLAREITGLLVSTVKY